MKTSTLHKVETAMDNAWTSYTSAKTIEESNKHMTAYRILFRLQQSFLMDSQERAA